MRWDILTGEYPPTPGGVSRYTSQVAEGLSRRGDEVHVWTPCGLEPMEVPGGVALHSLPDKFGPRALRVLNSALRPRRANRRILVQYVPHAFGWKAMNVPFCAW